MVREIPLQYEQSIEAYGGGFADFDVRPLDLPRRLVALKACRLVQGIEELRGNGTGQGVELPNAHVAAELERPRVRMGERTLEYGIEPALIRRCRKRLEAAIDPAAQGDRRQHAFDDVVRPVQRPLKALRNPTLQHLSFRTDVQ